MKDKIEKMIIVFVIIFGFYKLISWMNCSTTNTYTLEEIDLGVYVTKYESISSIPAKNFTIAEYCVSGSVHEVRGSVNISYTNEKPHVTIKEYKNAIDIDKATFYVPKGSVITSPSVGIGGR